MQSSVNMSKSPSVASKGVLVFQPRPVDLQSNALPLSYAPSVDSDQNITDNNLQKVNILQKSLHQISVKPNAGFSDQCLYLSN